jgi:hypothetical protein
LSKLWRTEEWKKNSEEFLKDNPFCLWHGEPVKATVPHHPQRKGSLTNEQYLSLEGCIPLCSSCNFAVEKGLKLCPICKVHYYKPNKKKGKDRCWECFCKTSFGKAVKVYYENHPKELKRKMRKK